MKSNDSCNLLVKDKIIPCGGKIGVSSEAARKISKRKLLGLPDTTEEIQKKEGKK